MGREPTPIDGGRGFTGPPIAPWRPAGRAAAMVLAVALGIVAAACGGGGGASSMAVARSADGVGVSGLLDAGDVAGVPGTLGSWTFDGAGSDSPWLPWSAPHAISIPAGVGVTLRLADGSSIGQWLADLAGAADTTGGTAQRLGGREAGAPPLDSIQLGRLPVGRWVLAARLFRTDGRGDGVTYWSVLVAP